MRLGGAFGLVALLLIVMIGLAVDNILVQRRADRQVAESAALQRDALTAKFRTADFDGWQTGYAFDMVRGVPSAAADEGTQRRFFLASAAAFRQDLARIGAHHLTAAQRQQLVLAEKAFDRFMDVDAKIVAGYRSGVPGRITVANFLVADEALRWSGQAAEGVDQLARLAQADVDADAAMAVRTSSRAMTIMIVVGVACVLLAVLLAIRVTRAVADAARHKATLAAIVEQSADATIAVTLDGTITTWNSGAERIYGYAADEVVGRSAATLLDPAQQARLPVTLAGLAQGHQLQVDESPRRRKDGTEIVVSTALWPLRDENGRLIGGAATERDITARKRREAQEKRAGERAAEAARLESLGQLAGGVAHDFNNLLAVILNCAEFMADEPGEQMGQDLARIRHAAERGRALTSQLMLFARREPNRVETVDLNAVVVAAADLLERTIGANITLRCTTGPGVLPVSAQRSRLDQILLNLVINARDAMPHGGVITIETDVADLPEGSAQPLPPGRYAHLTVRDDGSGMSAEVKDRIFEPFFTTKAAHRGTGLGLATVYGIVSEAGGSITVDSAPGAGTTFRILLPVAGQPACAGTGAAPAPSSGRGERILVVEDEDAVRDVVVRILHRSGYRTIAVRDAESALRAPFDDVALLITDMVLPDRPGRAVADMLRTREPGLPVLFMTGHGEAGHRTSGTARVLYKPFTADELLVEVGAAIGAARAVPV
ncbi:ATP-binding protein [Krasilnikovia sp. MM14-A1004]|uniref:hybrid sensor histidine kinase/response regulator n=1 Tax=Krasilnikovia sp. MM14-A1004 TaxID=3373541 RepID=UPI00399C7608